MLSAPTPARPVNAAWPSSYAGAGWPGASVSTFAKDVSGRVSPTIRRPLPAAPGTAWAPEVRITGQIFTGSSTSLPTWDAAPKVSSIGYAPASRAASPFEIRQVASKGMVPPSVTMFPSPMRLQPSPMRPRPSSLQSQLYQSPPLPQPPQHLNAQQWQNLQALAQARLHRMSGTAISAQAVSQVHAPAQPVWPPSPLLPLAEGEALTIGRNRFVMEKAIGEGAYAIVWSAKQVGASREVAIKEMCCGSGPGILPDATVQRAAFEVQVMKGLGGRLDEVAERASASSGSQIRSPIMIDHQFWPMGSSAPDAYVCRVAMTKVPGKSLVNWLEDFAESRLSDAQAGGSSGTSCGSSSSSSSSPCCSGLFRSVTAAKAMLLQLSPTFRKLNGTIAFHRDVCARNILAHWKERWDAESFEFFLVDFGSSVDASAWLGTSEGSWRLENPTGDARYWSPASWTRFLHGAEVLAKDEELLRQYCQRLDIFALAICAMETFGKIHAAECPREDVPGGAHGSKFQALEDGVWNVLAAWSSYWTFAVASFERLAEYSQRVCSGETDGAAQTWEELFASAVPEYLRSRLHSLCDTILDLAAICRTMEEDYLLEAAEFLFVVREMLHESSSVRWADVFERLSRVPERDPLQNAAEAKDEDMVASPVPETKVEELCETFADGARAEGQITPTVVQEAASVAAASEFPSTGPLDDKTKQNAAAEEIVEEEGLISTRQAVPEATTNAEATREGRISLATILPADTHRGPPEVSLDLQALKRLRQVLGEVALARQWYSAALQKLEPQGQVSTLQRVQVSLGAATWHLRAAA